MTPQCTVHRPGAEIETIYRAYQVLLLNLLLFRVFSAFWMFPSQLEASGRVRQLQAFPDIPYSEDRRH
jgi:hypothetical protein